MWGLPKSPKMAKSEGRGWKATRWKFGQTLCFNILRLQPQIRTKRVFLKNAAAKKAPPKVLAPFKSRITTSRALRTAATSPTNHAPLYGAFGFASSASAQDSQEGLHSEVALQKRKKKFISFFFNIFFFFSFFKHTTFKSKESKTNITAPSNIRAWQPEELNVGP